MLFADNYYISVGYLEKNKSIKTYLFVVYLIYLSNDITTNKRNINQTTKLVRILLYLHVHGLQNQKFATIVSPLIPQS